MTNKRRWNHTVLRDSAFYRIYVFIADNYQNILKSLPVRLEIGLNRRNRISPITMKAIRATTEPLIVKPCHTRQIGEHMSATMVRHINVARKVLGPIHQSIL